ncbi:MAG TPA: methyltransferase domain-containing protein [Chitinophagaceae bacterium]|nr:methyltransferase domain-containing protein [Chitinophagaceae bacterium]
MVGSPKDSWNAGLYTRKHAFVYQYGASLIDLLHPIEGERILDLGCGTGVLTHQIAKSGAEVMGMDSSPAMIGHAKRSYPQLSFYIRDARDFCFKNPFDAVFSNAVLHWIDEQEQVLGQIFQSLKPGGRLIAELGGLNNIRGIIEGVEKVLDRHGYGGNHRLHPWYFPAPAKYAGLLETRGFRVNELYYFDRETQLEDPDNGIVDWLNMFGNCFFKGIPPRKKVGLKVEIQDLLRPTHFREGSWFADYRRLRVKALKP